MDRPITTLFLLQSLDGKITTGDNDGMDTEDFHRITGIKEGLPQYYEIEKHLDRVYLNSGKVLEKCGFNNLVWKKDKNDGLSFAVIDNKPHLTVQGCEYLAKRSITFYVITNNANHPAFSLKNQFPNIVVLLYDKKINFGDAFQRLKTDYGVDRMTIQTGGTLNAEFLRQGLIDHVSIVIAPCLIGGIDTQSLIGGESLHDKTDLPKIKALKLIKCEALKDSYVHFYYDVVNETRID